MLAQCGASDGEENINFADVAAKTLLEKILDYKVRKRARQTALIEPKGQPRLQAVDNCNNVTNGCILDMDVWMGQDQFKRSIK